MAEGTTTHLALPYPTSAGEVKNGATNIKELAEAVDTFGYEGNKVANGQAYGALTERAPATLQEPSATRPTQVMLTVYLKPSEAARLKLKVGGVEIAVMGLDGTLPAGIPSLPVSFICPAGQSWEWSSENISKVMSSYLSL